MQISNCLYGSTNQPLPFALWNYVNIYAQVAAKL